MKRLVKKAKNGDKDALLQLVLERKDELYRLAYCYVENKHDAMDAMENMIVILYGKIDQLQKPESFYAWCKTILVNECRSILRKKKNVVYLEDSLTNLSNEQHETIDTNLHFDELINMLSPVQQEAIKLRYVFDYDFETIAQLTNVPVSTAKSRVTQAIKFLRNRIGGEKHERV